MFLKTSISDRRKACKKHPVNLQAVLYWILCLLGLDLRCDHRSKIKTVIVWLGQAVFITHFLFMVVINGALSIFCDKPNKRITKAMLASSFFEFGLGVLWYCLRTRRKRLSKAIERISNLQVLFKDQPNYRYENTGIVSSFLIYLVSVVSKLHPFTKEKYVDLLLHFRLFPIDKNVAWLVVYPWILLHNACMILFPACFVILYSIQCRNMRFTLSTYIQRKLTKRPLDEINSFRYYCHALSVFKEFERAISFSTLVFFASTMVSMVFILMHINLYDSSLNSNYLLVVNTVLMTATCFAAAAVNEADKVAKENNLERLEEVLDYGHRPSLQELMKFWRINQELAFSLSGWGFFSLTKGFYPSAMGCLLTYTLLIMSL